jgi:hypothetical protein
MRTCIVYYILESSVVTSHPDISITLYIPKLLLKIVMCYFEFPPLNLHPFASFTQLVRTFYTLKNFRLIPLKFVQHGSVSSL